MGQDAQTSSSAPRAKTSRRTRSISLSQLTMVERCKRSWYYQYELALGGQRADASADAQLAFALKNLTSIPGHGGSAIHELATDIAIAIRDKIEPPDQSTLVAKYVEIMAGPWRMREKKSRFLANPTRNGMYREHYYDEPVRAEDLEARKAKAREQISRLQRSNVWDDLQCCDAADIMIIESLDSLDLQFPGLDAAKLYGKPDLAYIRRAPLDIGEGIIIEPGECGIPILVDWKTGAIREESAMLQIGVYCYYMREKFRIAPHPMLGGYLCRVVDLSSDGNDLVCVVTPLDIERARIALKRGLEAMAPLLDARGHISREKAERTPDTTLCRWCIYRDLCLRVDGLVQSDTVGDAAA